MDQDEPKNSDELDEVSQDITTPFSPADDNLPAGTALNDAHPATDDKLDPTEVYDEGISGAAEASEPNTGNNILGFKKPDQ